MIITGTPGIEKSLFSIYVLFRALNSGRDVLFTNQLFDVTIFFDQKRGKAFSIKAHNAAQEFMDRNTLYLYDAGTRLPPYYHFNPGRLIVFSSPAKENYADILKGNSILLYMPTWTCDELEIVTVKLRLDKQSVTDLYSMFGGIPRYVLCTSETRNKQQLRELNTTCEQITSPDVLMSLGSHLTKDSHKILHLFADKTYTEACQQINVKFCASLIQFVVTLVKMSH